jgi:hypothetical protein
MSGYDQAEMVDEAALVEYTCSQCRFFHLLPCPEKDWENRDPVSKPCVCFEEAEENTYEGDCK